MVRIHLWAPTSSPLSQWISIIEDNTNKFQQTYSTEVKRSYGHLRSTPLTRHNVDHMIARKNEKGEINILIVNHLDLNGPESLERILHPLIEAFNGSVHSQLLIFDLIRVRKDSRQTTQNLKRFLYQEGREENLVVINDFSPHKCFHQHIEICIKCLIKANLSLSFALLQTRFRRLARIKPKQRFILVDSDLRKR
jgi:hypothetical protein